MGLIEGIRIKYPNCQQLTDGLVLYWYLALIETVLLLDIGPVPHQPIASRGEALYRTIVVIDYSHCVCSPSTVRPTRWERESIAFTALQELHSSDLLNINIKLVLTSIQSDKKVKIEGHSSLDSRLRSCTLPPCSS